MKPTNTQKEQVDTLTDLIPGRELNPFLVKLMEAAPHISVILDEDRRIVFANRKLLDTLAISSFSRAFGSRLGDVFNCRCAAVGPDGCGSAEGCKLCGAYRAIEDSRNTLERQVRECRISTDGPDRNKAFDFRVISTPVEWDNRIYFLITVEDISHEKRKTILERLFFHDLMNAVNGISGALDLLKGGSRSDNVLDILESGVQAMTDTIRQQRQITLAESGDLTVNRKKTDAAELLERTVINYRNSLFDQNMVEINSPGNERIPVNTDPALAGRVLTNMIKNAVEANGNRGAVKAGVRKDKDHVEFYTWNPEFIDRDVQLQIFERSFSTKGRDRGLGTYSMKLIGENYLDGRVTFTSLENEGTTFHFFLPLED